MGRALPGDREQPSRVLAAVADGNRLHILTALAEKDRTATELVEAVPISRQGIAKHLDVMREAGLVTSYAGRGRNVVHRIEIEPLREAARFLDEMVTRWDRAPSPATSSAVGSSPITRHALDALDTEVRRTSRERRRGQQHTTITEETA